ncbi:hypothetical protein [Enterovibrio paralichthyis]|uniref:hypothetical protein n=1 Tax=Enterovibrio paralichthyis TaxID=2853805 RepID=UPI003AB97675
MEAVADGRIVAQAIDRFLNGDMENVPRLPFNSRKEPSLKHVDPCHFSAYPKKARSIMPELTRAQREQSFAEVELGFESADAIAEAARCLECDCQANTACDLRDYATEYHAEQTFTCSVDVKNHDAWQAQRQRDHRHKFSVDRSAGHIPYRNRAVCGCSIAILFLC